MKGARNWFDSQPDFSEAEQDASPIVIDLNGDGVKTLALAGKRHFDLDNNGFAEQTAWVDGGDGLLVRDLDGNGRIESGAELFGDHTGFADGTMAADGYAALAEHDDNGDGLIDAKDPIWRELQVWRDENSDAHSAAEELHPLADFDITAISLAAKRVSETDAAGNRIFHRGTVRRAEGFYRITENKQPTGTEPSQNNLFQPFAWDCPQTRDVFFSTHVPHRERRREEICEGFSLPQGISSCAAVI